MRKASPLAYVGGKTIALKYILKFYNLINFDEYREPFCGSATVFFAMKKSKFNWLNDIDPDLITFYKVIADKDKRKELAAIMLKEEISERRFNELKELKPKNDLEIALKYYYVNNTCFSGNMVRQDYSASRGERLNNEKLALKILKAGKKLEGVKITNKDFEQVISGEKEGKSVFMYLDPPYYKINTAELYKYTFSEKDHIRLAKALEKTKYKFLLSYDNCEEIRELYDWASQIQIKFVYSHSKCNNGKRIKKEELLITNLNTIDKFSK